MLSDKVGCFLVRSFSITFYVLFLIRMFLLSFAFFLFWLYTLNFVQYKKYCTHKKARKITQNKTTTQSNSETQSQIKKQKQKNTQKSQKNNTKKDNNTKQFRTTITNKKTKTKKHRHRLMQSEKLHWFFSSTFINIFRFIVWAPSIPHFKVLGSIRNLQAGVAGPVIQANGRLTFEDDLRSGGLLCFILMNASVRTELADSMVTPGEPGGD